MIKLTADEVSLLLQTDAVPFQLRSRLSAAGETGLALEEDTAELLLEYVTERLMTDGFDASYRLTEGGRALERLVDRLTWPVSECSRQLGAR